MTWSLFAALESWRPIDVHEYNVRDPNLRRGHLTHGGAKPSRHTTNPNDPQWGHIKASQ